MPFSKMSKCTTQVCTTSQALCMKQQQYPDVICFLASSGRPWAGAWSRFCYSGMSMQSIPKCFSMFLSWEFITISNDKLHTEFRVWVIIWVFCNGSYFTLCFFHTAITHEFETTWYGDGPEVAQNVWLCQLSALLCPCWIVWFNWLHMYV